MKLISCTFLLTMILLSVSNQAKSEEHSPQTMAIATKIRLLQPNLTLNTATKYAALIRFAGIKYGVQPEVLTVIVYQESSFRENVREGAAGEVGICQIRKMWLSDRRFVTEFPNASLTDLKRPETSFTFAAFILSQLKSNYDDAYLPYWTKYNSNRTYSRIRYFAEVSRHLTKLREREFPFVIKLKRGLAYEGK